MQFDEDILTTVHVKEVGKSHSGSSNRELKKADKLGESGFGKFERVLCSILDVGDLSGIDVLELKFFDNWTFESEDIIKIRDACEQNMNCIRGNDISFDIVRCRYNNIPFVIGSWRSSEDFDTHSKCNIYVRKKTDFQPIYNEIIGIGN